MTNEFSIPKETKKVNGLINHFLFGPVESRRFGVSLGVNLLPPQNKICTFNCPYCECGWTDLSKSRGIMSELQFPNPEDIYTALEECLTDYKASNKPHIQHITLSGNGEPTMHPQFSLIVPHIRKIVDQYYNEAKFVLLTNGTFLDDPEIRKCLPLIDSLNVKLDAADEVTFKKMNGPIKGTLADLVKTYKTLSRFNIQTMFMDGAISNISDEHIEKWLELICELKPEQVQVYTIERKTPTDRVKPVSKEFLQNIRDLLIARNIKAQSY